MPKGACLKFFILCSFTKGFLLTVEECHLTGGVLFKLKLGSPSPKITFREQKRWYGKIKVLSAALIGQAAGFQAQDTMFPSVCPRPGMR